MSKATRQAMAMLAVASGCMGTIEVGHLADHVLPTVLYIKDLADQSLVAYTKLATGSQHKNFLWMESKTEEWNAAVRNRQDSTISAIVLTQMPMLALDELLIHYVRDPRKIALIFSVHQALQGLLEQLDPDGEQVEAYHESLEVLERFFTILEFTDKSQAAKKRKVTLSQLQQIADTVAQPVMPDPWVINSLLQIDTSIRPKRGYVPLRIKI